MRSEWRRCFWLLHAVYRRPNHVFIGATLRAHRRFTIVCWGGRYSSLLELINQCDGFADCPQGKSAGSFDSEQANYKSHDACRDLLQALADSTRVFWGPRLRESPRVGFMQDESGDDAHHAQNMMAYKLYDLASAKVAVIYAGVTRMPRGTAEYCCRAMLHQLKKDLITLEIIKRVLSGVSFDSCSVNFGEHAGVVRLLTALIPWVIAIKCVSHGLALALKHAAESVPIMKREVIPTLKQAGRLMDDSSKKQQFMAEVNELLDTDALALSRAAETRWGSICRSADKLKDPAHYAAQVEVFRRAGEGGDQDFYIVDAGRADPTAAGVEAILLKQSTAVCVQWMNDALPITSTVSTGFQARTLDCKETRKGVATMIEFCEAQCSPDPAVAQKARPLSCDAAGKGWRNQLEQIEKALGKPLKRVARRDDAFLSRTTERLSDALLASLKQYLPPTKIMDHLTKLLDVDDPSHPGADASNVELDEFYEDALAGLAEHFCGSQGGAEDPFFTESALRHVWETRRRRYFDEVTAWSKKRAQQLNRAERSRVDQANAKKRAGSAREKPTLVSRAPMLSCLEYAASLSFVSTEDVLMFLICTWLVTACSQAPVESMFSRMKLIVTRLRHRLSQCYLDMLFAVAINGPHSKAGVTVGYDEEEFIDTAYKIWCARDLQRRVSVAATISMPDGYVEYEWGVGFDTSEAASIIEKKQAQAERRRREAAQAPARPGEDGLDLDAAAAAATVEIEKPGGAENSYVRAMTAEGLRLLAVDLEAEARPAVNDEIVATGFGGTCWWQGTVVTVAASGRQPYLVYFDADNMKCQMALSSGRYGPAKVTPKRDGGEDTVSAGWLFVLPTVSAPAAAGAGERSAAIDGGK